MATATYEVVIGWAASSGSAFTFGDSTLDGGDVLSGQFFSLFDGLYDDVTDVTRSFSLKRGRDGALDQMTAGQATITLHDPAGTYNPRNEGGPLYGQIVPMRPVRITATHNGTDYPLFYGFIDSVDFDPGSKTATVTARDLFVWLGRVNPTVASTGAATTGYAIGQILDDVGVDPGARSLVDGDDIPDFEADGTTSALSLIAGLLATERGVFYMAADGTATYEDRYAWGLRTESAAFASSMSGMEAGVALDGVKNRAKVTRTGSSQQSASDGTSIGLYGAADAEAIDSAYLNTDGQALALAEYLVALQKDPRPPVRGMSLVNTTTAQLDAMLGLELGDNIEVTETTGDTSGNYTVQSVEHRVERGGKLHTTNVAMTWRTGEAEPFIFGSSTLDGGDILAY